MEACETHLLIPPDQVNMMVGDGDDGDHDMRRRCGDDSVLIPPEQVIIVVDDDDDMRRR